MVSTIAGDGTEGFADGPSATAKFDCPRAVCVDAAGNLVVADYRVRMISSAGVVSTIAGDGTKGFADGPSATAKFNRPRAVCVDAAGNLVVADWGNDRVRMISGLKVHEMGLAVNGLEREIIHMKAERQTAAKAEDFMKRRLDQVGRVVQALRTAKAIRGWLPRRRRGEGAVRCPA